MLAHSERAQNSRKTDDRFCFWFFAKYGGSKTTNIVLAKSMPMRSAPTDSILLRCSPTDFTDLHRLSGCVVSPTEFHRCFAERFSHRFHRFTQIVWARSVSHRIHRIHRSMVQKKSHRFHRARRSLSLKHLCNSVKSVGVYLIRSFCEFGVFRGRTSQQKLLWIRRIPWENISAEASVNSAYSVGVHRSSRLRGVGRDAVPSYVRSL